MNKAIEQKKHIFYKIAFIVSILSIVLAGTIKYVFNVDWFIIGIPQQLSNFPLFKNIYVQYIIMHMFLMFNYVIAIAIIDKVSIENIISKIWWLLLLTFSLNLLDREIIYILSPLLCIPINIIYLLRSKQYKLKNISLSTLKMILIIAIFFLAQIATVLIKTNEIPPPDKQFSFYKLFLLNIDIYLMAYFYYKFKGKE